MSILSCPVCRQPLQWDAQGMVCPSGHRFDRARQGYVNLLRSQASSAKRHGDDKRMVAARCRFLSGGYYAPLLDAVSAAAAEAAPRRYTLLDAGCGEGYYTEGLFRALSQAGKTGCMTAIDISKDALKAAGRRPFPHDTAVASVFALPVPAGSCDLVVSIFAPCAPGEFSRVLKRGGSLLRVVPLRRHLFGLKAAIYDSPYENPEEDFTLPGFSAPHVQKLCWNLTLDDPADIQALFEMTPYYYKTSAADQAKAAALTHLETELAFGILHYRKDD